jgi:cysteine desulfurase
VIQEMSKVDREYGNPSSTHSLGRAAKNMELSRKSIAKNLNATAQEIIFLLMWNRSQQLILRSAVKDFKVKRIITSKIEPCFLYTALVLEKEFGIQLIM